MLLFATVEDLPNCRGANNFKPRPTENKVGLLEENKSSKVGETTFCLRKIILINAFSYVSISTKRQNY